METKLETYTCDKCSKEYDMSEIDLIGHDTGCEVKNNIAVYDCKCGGHIKIPLETE